MSNTKKLIGWMDLTVADADTVRDYYAQVIGLTVDNVAMGEYNDYCLTLPDSEDGQVGVCHARGDNAYAPPMWVPYFFVEDLPKSLETALAKGGSAFSGNTPSAENGFAILADPAGAAHALFQRPKSTRPEFKGAFPISGDPMKIPVKEFGPAVAFYTKVLGFEVAEKTVALVTLKRDAATIGLVMSKDDPEQASYYFSVDGLEALRQDYVDAGLEPSELRNDTHDGKKFRVFFAKEPYGVCFCFGEPA